jgi:nucleoside-diphosphate-sugar epimerase
MSMRRIAVTGISGFLGNEFARLARGSGAWLLGISRSNPNSLQCDEHFTLSQSLVGAPKVAAEEINRLADTLSRTKVEVVIHLAAEFIAHHNTPEQALRLVDTNVRLGVSILEACRLSGVPRVILAGSAWQHFQGEDYFPVSLYAATRQGLDSIARHYAESENLKIMRLHFFDSYGEEDRRGKLLGLLKQYFDASCSAFFGKKPTPPVFKTGKGDQLIDLLHVNDLANALIQSTTSDTYYRESFPLYTVRSGYPLPVRQVIEQVVALFKEKTGQPLPIDWGALTSRPREMREDWNFAPQLPGWTPKISLSSGLRKYFLG